MLGEVGRLWATHRRSPFPDVPAASKGDLVELDTWLAGCVSTYLANDGDLDRGRQNVMTKCLPKLRRYVAQLGYPWAFPEAFAYFRLLLKMTELIHNDKAQEGGG